MVGIILITQKQCGNEIEREKKKAQQKASLSINIQQRLLPIHGPLKITKRRIP